MADIALVFHWTPADMAGLSLGELMQWRERARVRYERGDAD
ncbi:GpE family phage tail protein [Paracidovorax avenae]|nr:GpE family phage tail protein [Paracidovorax avenae]AVS66633.1 GpE family phage tail protein [Paracidovorax avenae]